MTVLSAIYITVLGIYLTLAVLVIVRNPRAAVNWFCAALFFCLALWAFEDIFHNLTPPIPPAHARLLGNIGAIGGYCFASCFFLFARSLTKQRLQDWRYYLPVILIPALLIFGQWTGINQFAYRVGRFGWAVDWRLNFWTGLFYLSYPALTFWALMIIARFRRTTAQLREKKQATVILVAALTTLLLASLTDIVLPVLGFEVPELGGAFGVIWATGLTIGMLRYGLLAITPETAARDILATMPDPLLLLGPDGRVAIANQALYDQLHLHPDEVIGQPAEKLFHQCHEFTDLFRRVADGELLKGVELLCRSHNQHLLPVSVSARLMRDRRGNPLGSVWVLRDITEEKRALAACQASEHRFQQVVENAHEWIWEMDPEGRYTYASPVVKEILGYQPEELVGKKYFYDLLVPEERAEEQSVMLAALHQREAFRGIVSRNRTKDGRIVWLSRSGVPILDRDGRLVGYRGADSDVTETKEAEEALRTNSARLAMLNLTLEQEQKKLFELTQELQRANEELKRLSEAKSDFVAAVSHDLRTPLTTIIEGIALVEDGTLGPVNPEQQKFLGYAREDAERLGELINNLLDVAKIERGKMEVRKTRLDVLAATTRTVKSYVNYIQEKGLSLKIENPPEPLAVECDPGHYHRILTNLLSNAIKFTPAGGSITIRFSRNDAHQIVTSVQDTGIGIPEEHRHRIFGKFEQVHYDSSGLTTGTGLGLALCRQLVELNGGSIGFESTVNQGSTFFFALPEYRDSPVAGKEPDAQPEK